VTESFQGPLLLDWAAEEDEAESEGNGPYDDESSTYPDPITEVQGEHSSVEAQLAELEAGKRPEVYQGERKRDLSGQPSSESLIADVPTCIMKGMLLTSLGYTSRV
jgi:hypothetical protein